MNPTVLPAERERFSRVVAARKTNQELFELFGKLKESDKFSAEAKPYLALDLIAACIRRVPARQSIALLQAMEASQAMAFIRSSVPVDQLTPVLGDLVVKTLQNCTLEEGPLMEAFIQLERSGVCAERGETLDLAIGAGMSTAVLDQMCNLTFEAYYLCT